MREACCCDTLPTKYTQVLHPSPTLTPTIPSRVAITNTSRPPRDTIPKRGCKKKHESQPRHPTTPPHLKSIFTHLLVVQCRKSTLLRLLLRKKWLKDHRHPSVKGSPSMSGEYEYTCRQTHTRAHARAHTHTHTTRQASKTRRLERYSTRAMQLLPHTASSTQLAPKKVFLVAY